MYKASDVYIRSLLLVELGDVLVEALALNGGNLELERRRLPRTVTTGEGAGTPGGATVNLSQVGELSERVGVAERDEGDAVVSERGESRDRGRLLATTCK